MKWNHIYTSYPKDGELIIQVDEPHDMSTYPNDFKRHYTMGMRLYNSYGTPYPEHMKWCEENNIIPHSFWWTYAKDFPFPDQPERSKREDSVKQATVPNITNDDWKPFGCGCSTEMRCSEHCGNTVREVQQASSPDKISKKKWNDLVKKKILGARPFFE